MVPEVNVKNLIVLYFLLCGSTMAFLTAEEIAAERHGYIVGTFLTGLGEHLRFLHGNSPQGFGTCVETINGGTVGWSNTEENANDTTVSWPLIFDMKLISKISKFRLGFTFGDLLTISMNENYKDANHLYFGLCYIHSIKKWDIGASLIVFPVYIDDDELIAGKIDISYWLIKNIGITASTTFGGTTGWSDVRVLLFNILAGISIKI
jgi:hypothetical protein